MDANALQLLAVFDGHGPNGHEVSQYLKDMVPEVLFAHDSFPHDMATALKATILTVETFILQSVCSSCAVPLAVPSPPPCVAGARRTARVWARGCCL